MTLQPDREWTWAPLQKPTMNPAYRIAVRTIGLFVVMIVITYPGSGWLIVFFGVGILAIEFIWARIDTLPEQG